MSQENVNLLRAAYAAFAEGDVPAVLAAMDPQIRWNEAENFPYADGNPYVGPEAVVEGVFKRLGADWAYWKIHVEEVFASADRVVVLGRYEGAHNRTGKKIDAQFAHIWRVTDGLISDFQQYTDTAQVRDAVGPG